MKEKLKELMQNKLFHISVIIIIITILLCTLIFVTLKYNVEGETNMPFNLSKIAVISTAEGIDKENNAIYSINQNNDVFIYIEKNNNYKKSEEISSVVINNFNFEKQNENTQINLYKPDALDEKQIFKTADENKKEGLEYIGDVKSDIKFLKMSNKGDMIAFRLSNLNIKEYTASEEDTINFNELLKKAEVNNEDLKFKVSFDITIKLKSGKEFNSRITLDLPTGNLVEEGRTVEEITNSGTFIFKRIKN